MVEHAISWTAAEPGAGASPAAGLQHPRAAYALALFTTLVTWCLIVIGGLVHNKGASLACPDWPLCYGDMFPEMTGGVLYEHGHRYLGTLVGLCTIALTVLLWQAHPHRPGIGRRKGLALAWGAFVGLGGGFLITPAGQASIVRLGIQSTAPWLIAALFVGLLVVALACIVWRPEASDPNLAFKALGLLLLVIFQGLLGGATVAYRLPTIVSTGHLATSMLVLLTWIFIAYSLKDILRAGRGDAEWKALLRTALPTLNPWLLLTVSVVFIQIILGALVRHTDSHMAAGIGWNSALLGTDPASGLHAWWPTSGPAQLNMAHRYVALLVMLLIIACCTRVWLRLGDLAQHRLGRILLIWAPFKLALIQVFVGVTMVGLLMQVALRTLHLAMGALLLASIWLLVIALREGGRKLPANGNGR